MIHNLIEDEFHHQAVVFAPVEVPDSTDVGTICDLCDFNKGEHSHHLLCGRVACLKHQRADGKNVIWKKQSTEGKKNHE